MTHPTPKNLLLQVAMARVASHRGNGWSPGTFTDAMKEVGAKNANGLFHLTNKIVMASEKQASLDPAKQWTLLKAAAEKAGESAYTSMVFASVVTEMLHPKQASTRTAGLTRQADAMVPMEIVAQVLPEYASQMTPLGLTEIRLGTLVESPMFMAVKTAAARVYTYLDPDGTEYYSLARRIGPFTTRMEVTDSVGTPASTFVRDLRDLLAPGAGEE